MINEKYFRNVVLESAKKVFKTMVSVPIAKTSNPTQKIEGDSLLGLVTFRGALEGSLNVCCGLPCAEQITVSMLGIDPLDEIYREEVIDTVGEVTNMIMEELKLRICENVGNLKVSIPSVVSGLELKSSLGDGASEVVVEVAVNDNYSARLSLLYREDHDALGED